MIVSDPRVSGPGVLGLGTAGFGTASNEVPTLECLFSWSTLTSRRPERWALLCAWFSARGSRVLVGGRAGSPPRVFGPA